MRVRSARSFDAEDVKVSEVGVPTSFRIWGAGANSTDHGVHMFTEQSAQLLLNEQAMRGNLYSIDVDHLSLSETAPPEARKAVGWHKLAVIDGDMWAVDVEWTSAVASGFSTNPPEWRYFSPAYDVDRQTGQIVSYTNTALTNNPATWHVTALATRLATRETDMDLKTAVAAAMGDDDEQREAARAAIKAMSDKGDKKASAVYAAMFGEPDGDEGDGKDKPEDKGDDDEKKSTKQTAEESATAATAATSIAASAKLVDKIGEQERRLTELESIRDKGERERIFASRPDLTKAQRSVLESEPTDRLEKLLGLIAKPAGNPAASVSVQATRGDTQGGVDEIRAARLPPNEHEALKRSFGTLDEHATIRWDRNDRVFPQISKIEAKRILALHAKGAVK